MPRVASPSPLHVAGQSCAISWNGNVLSDCQRQAAPEWLAVRLSGRNWYER